MSEPAEKIKQDPGSYSPKDKPVILQMAEKANGRQSGDYCVRTTDGDKYIDGVPMLKWGEWRDNTYCGSIAAALEVLRTPVSYETLMGVSGLCYRFAMKSTWCPSSALAQNSSVWDENINAAAGIEIHGIADDAERDRQVKANLDSGRPVICMGQIGSPEWGIITGYSEKENVFFGRSYFDSQNMYPGSRYYTNDSIFHTRNLYRRAVNYPGVYPRGFLKFFDKPYPKAEPAGLLKKSLEICLAYSSHKEFNECKFGEAAFRILIEGFEKSDEEWRDFRRNENYHVGVLADARRSAYAYLKESAPMLKGVNKEKLSEAAEYYGCIAEDILSAVPYKMLNEDFAFNGNNEEPWDTGIRRKLAAALYKAIDTEKKAQSIIREILSRW